MIEDATQDAINEVSRLPRHSEHHWLVSGSVPKQLTGVHAAVLRRVRSGLVLGPWSKVLVYGPKHWPKREHKALIQLVRVGVLRVARVSGEDMTGGHAPSIVPPGSHFYYEIVPEARLYAAARDRRARRVVSGIRRRRDPSQLRMFGEAGHGQLDLYTTADPDVYVVYLDRGVRSTKRLRRSEARAFLKELPKSAWTRETREVARALGVR